MLLSSIFSQRVKQLLNPFFINSLFFVWLFVIGNVCAQNQVGVKNTNQINPQNTGGGGVSSINNNIIYSETGSNNLDADKPYNIHFLLNNNFDTIKTNTYSIAGNVSGDFIGFRPFNYKNDLYFDGLATNFYSNYFVYLYAKSNVNSLNITNYKAYISKNICLPGEIKQFINDSIFISSHAFKYATSFNQNNFSLWWLNKNLDTLNQKVYINNKNCNAQGCFPLQNKELLVFGGTDSIDTGDAFIMKLDSNGNLKWAKSIGTAGQEGFDMVKVNNSYYLIGNTNVQSLWATPYSEITLAKIDTGGNVLKTFKIITDHVVWAAKTTVIGNSIVMATESFTTTGSSERRGLFLKIDTNGVVQNQYIIGQTHNGYINFRPLSICSDSSKNIYCTFWRWNLNSDPFYSALIKLDSNLVGCYPSEPAFNFTTTVAPVGFLHNLPMHFRVAKDSIYEVFGTINQGHGFNTIVDECSGYVGVKENVTENQSLKFYPNPSNGLFNYELLDANSMVDDYTMEVYNTAGVIIKRFSITKNNLHGSIDLTEFSNGMYFIKVINKNKIVFNTKLSVIQ